MKEKRMLMKTKMVMKEMMMKKIKRLQKYDEQDDAEGGRNDEEEGGSYEEDDNEETREEESFDPIPKTSEGSMESIFATASSSVVPLYTSTPIMTPSAIATITTISQALIPPTPIPSDVLQNLPTFASVFRLD
nr:hypothetical protein [Tanacetum cinerariifolium]